jgi:hypothetical protein
MIHPLPDWHMQLVWHVWSLWMVLLKWDEIHKQTCLPRLEHFVVECKCPILPLRLVPWKQSLQSRQYVMGIFWQKPTIVANMVIQHA